MLSAGQLCALLSILTVDTFAKAKDVTEAQEEQRHNITYFIGPEHGILPVPTDEGSGAGLDFHDGNIQADQGQQTLHGIPVEAAGICKHRMNVNAKSHAWGRSYSRYIITQENEIIHRDIICETKTGYGGWIVIARRTKGNVDFYKDWKSYRDGFGDYGGDFFLGLEALHKLTSKKKYKLRIDFTIWVNKTKRSGTQHEHFEVGPASDGYRLYLPRTEEYNYPMDSGISGSHSLKFSTHDNDNDQYPGKNCAEEWHGAWWYGACGTANLFGKWGDRSRQGITWYKWFDRGGWYYPEYFEMMMRHEPPRKRP